MKRSVLFLAALAALLSLPAAARAQSAPAPVLSAVSGRVQLFPGAFVPMAAAPATGVCGTAAHCTSLTWTETSVAPTGYTLTYNVLRGTASGQESATPINAAPLTTTSYVDPVTLTSANQTFYYEVQAVETGAIVQTATSSEVSATFPSLLAAPAPAAAEQ